MDSRHLHTATLLPNGKVLVAGGFASGVGPLASAQIYDPKTGTWNTRLADRRSHGAHRHAASEWQSVGRRRV